MKLIRKRDAEATAPVPDGAVLPPAAPPGTPVAAYAGILDGRTLWLAAEATSGALALRDEAGGVIPLRSDLAESDPAYRSVRADLDDLPGDGEATYDVVLVQAGGRGPRPVWIEPFRRTPTRVPRSPGGRWQFRLARTEDGMLRVRRGVPTAGLDVLHLETGRAGIRVAFAATDADELRLVEDDTVLAAFPVIRDDDHCASIITEAGLPDGTGQLARLLVGDLPLRRRADDLTNPNQAVLLPVLFGDDPDLARLRLRWSPEGTLVARVVDRDEGEDG